VGEKTAQACHEYFPGSEIVVSPVSTGAGLGADMLGLEKGRVLFPCAKEAGNDLEQILCDAGWHIDRFEIYETVSEQRANLPDIEPKNLDYICFTRALAAVYT